jgi:hypothetical protein
MTHLQILKTLWFLNIIVWVWYHSRLRMFPNSDNDMALSMLFFVSLIILDVLLSYQIPEILTFALPFVIITNSMLAGTNNIMCAPVENVGCRYVWDSIAFAKIGVLISVVISYS